MGVIKRHETGRIGDGCAEWVVRLLFVLEQNFADLLGEGVENRIVRFFNLGTIACRAIQLATLTGDIVGLTV